AVVAVHLQQSQPDLGLRLRRIRAADAGEGRRRRGSLAPRQAVSAARESEFITELFVAFGPVTVRRMFSGAGVFADGMMIALVVRGVIYLKADAQFVAEFEREGLGPFSYQTKDGSRTLNSYWRMPERLYDDPDELSTWARRSMEAARRADARPSGKKSSKRKPGKSSKR